MKTAKLIELERQRGDLMREAREALHAIKDNTDPKRSSELERAHDEVMCRYDILNLDIEEERLNATDAQEREARRPGGNGTAPGIDDGAARSFDGGAEWRDDKGNPVKVLSRNEKLSSRSDGLSVGDLVRAKITGARNEEEKRALAEGTDSAGGFTVPTPLAENFIDRMRARSVAVQAGAMTVPMTSETLAIARLASDPDVAWRAENAAIAEGDPTFERVTFTAKTLAGKIKLSRELAEDSINVGAMIEQAFAGTMAKELDYAAIWGDGTGNAPTGVFNTTGVNAVAMATNGAALADYDKPLDALFEIKNSNAADPTAMIMNPRTEIALAKLKDADGNPLTVPNAIARIPLLSTTGAPVDETQGTASNASSIVMGDYTQLMLGMRHQLEIRVFDQTLAETGQLLVVAWLRADVQLAQPKAFAKLTGITPA
ncbi:phage major capsid protein [Aurantiacibacter sp. MUD61]|uniref:phage major capsid protein n=1 Tax=Aurantiacibacter sp. MUD61 TaxID=3009083 RepID=UPI0022F07EE2|nr:phage major capsid protein [Aurantiacibacter sp. MUD61]